MGDGGGGDYVWVGGEVMIGQDGAGRHCGIGRDRLGTDGAGWDGEGRGGVGWYGSVRWDCKAWEGMGALGSLAR